jgi:UDP-N-acetylmuramate dehydrogenase
MQAIVSNKKTRGYPDGPLSFYNHRAMTASLLIQRDVSLRKFNTFGIDAKASAYARIMSADDLQAVRSDETLVQMPRLVLGGGSNILLTRDFPGLVLHIGLRGLEIVGADEDATYVRAAGGENWHDLVNWTLEHDLGGLENLALIPGTVGAAPVQNIGAYGAELKDCFHSLQAFDFKTGKTVTFSRADCVFGYRDSVFKHAFGDRAVIMEVTFALPKRWKPNLEYAELARELAETKKSVPDPRDVSNAVIGIRRRKLTDPAVMGNAGSFFKNPTVSASLRDALLRSHPQLPSYPQPDGNYRLAAGWLVDQCHWKGRNLGAAGVSATQALVLVNRGGAHGADIVQLANAIQSDVKSRFGVQLEAEPVFV